MKPTSVYRVETLVAARALTDSIKGSWIVVHPDDEERMMRIEESTLGCSEITLIVCEKVKSGVFIGGVKQLETGLKS